jgi:hypothetical protein
MRRMRSSPRYLSDKYEVTARQPRALAARLLELVLRNGFESS